MKVTFDLASALLDNLQPPLARPAAASYQNRHLSRPAMKFNDHIVADIRLLALNADTLPNDFARDKETLKH